MRTADILVPPARRLHVDRALTLLMTTTTTRTTSSNPSPDAEPSALELPRVRVLLTGAAGFLGRVLVHELLAPTSEARLDVVELRALDTIDFGDAARGDGRSHLVGPEDPRVAPVRADVRDRTAVRSACEGVDIVLHAAAMVDWSHASDELLEQVNVHGTRNVIDACVDAGVEALVFTSTEDVVYSGRPLRDVDESQPYPARFVNAYCRTKAEAEQAVLRADGRRLDSSARGGRADGAGTLRTAALRPVGIWGEGDPFHIGSLVEMARRGQLFRIGDGTARCQHVYVHNVAHAHVCAAVALLTSPEAARGRTYFVTDSAPANFFDYLAPVIEGAGYPVRSRRWALPRRPLWAAGAVADLLAWTLAPIVRLRPKLSRFAVDYVTQDFTFRSARAAQDLSYRPVVTEHEARARTIEWLRQRR